MKKNTSDLLSELKECDSFGSFYNNNQLQFTETNVGQYLNSLVERKNLKKSAVIKSSELSEIYGYQIFSGIRRPDRSKLLPIVLAMHLTVEETQELVVVRLVVAVGLSVPAPAGGVETRRAVEGVDAQP